MSLETSPSQTPRELLVEAIAATERQQKADEADAYSAPNHRRMMASRHADTLSRLKCELRAVMGPELPWGVRFDGVAIYPRAALLMFTEIAETQSSLGLAPADGTPERIAEEAETMRRKFREASAAGSSSTQPSTLNCPREDPPRTSRGLESQLSSDPLPPCYPRAPRVFLPVDRSHY